MEQGAGCLNGEDGASCVPSRLLHGLRRAVLACNNGGRPSDEQRVFLNQLATVFLKTGANQRDIKRYTGISIKRLRRVSSLGKQKKAKVRNDKASPEDLNMVKEWVEDYCRPSADINNSVYSFTETWDTFHPRSVVF